MVEKHLAEEGRCCHLYDGAYFLLRQSGGLLDAVGHDGDGHPQFVGYFLVFPSAKAMTDEDLAILRWQIIYRPFHQGRQFAVVEFVHAVEG